MINILVAAMCIPFVSCGQAPQEKRVEPIKIEPDVRIEARQEQMMQQAPIRDRIYDKMANWCENERAYIERELRSGEAHESEKYRHYLRLKYRNLMEKCETRYKGK